MNGLQVYLDARAAEATSGEHWYDVKKLTEIETGVRADLGKMYRFLDRLDARLADLRGPATLPKRKSSRTPTQERVSKCPRCGSRDVAA